jgi:hypothetical protein
VPTRRINWARYDDERLLDLRFCDLALRFDRTPLAEKAARLHEELDDRGIRHKPHVWLSSEWFSPDGIPGIAFPFYLAHPRLRKLEKKQMLEVEGGAPAECMRILRHEAGHAIDTAYRLHRRKRWREIFGSFRQPYPQTYKPKPNSRNYVVHLAAWYAQAHPAEDFAETFAVWLTPRSRWRERYKNWYAALEKLEYVDELMHEIAGQPAPVRTRLQVYPLADMKMTLRQHYRKKRAHYGVEWDDYYDRDLARIFSNDRRHAGKPTAAGFLRGIRREIRERIAEWTGAHIYTVDQVLQDLIDRSREKKLRVAMPANQARQEAVMLVTVHTMNCMHWTHREIPL